MQVAISYTTSPVHNIDYFVKYAKTSRKTGADSICIKDMAGLLVPYETYDLVKALKETVKIPIQIHSHFTAGIADMVMIKAIEAGADVIDTAMSPLALGTSHPATEVHGGRPQGHGVRHGAGPGDAQRAEQIFPHPADRNIWTAACSTPKCWRWTPMP